MNPPLPPERKALPERKASAHSWLPDFCAIGPVFILILFAELLSIVFTLVSHGLVPFPWETLALISLFNQWVALTTAGLLCIGKRRLIRIPSQHAALICFVIIVGVTFLFSLLAPWMLWNLKTPDWAAVLRNVIISGIIGGLIVRYFYVSGQLEAQRRSDLVHRLQALQARIHPHFLFNSMNIIASLIETHPALAEKAVEDLSALFRVSLCESASQATLQQELDLCRRYLNIEQLRLGERLQTHWDIPADMPMEACIPLLTLQPLIENAIYHGIQLRETGGTLSVVARTVVARNQNTIISLCITNPLPERPSSGNRGNHLALDNIRHRLAVLFGNKARFQTEIIRNEFIARLSFPANTKIHESIDLR